MKKFIITLTTLLAAAVAAGAQNVETQQEYAQFSGIEASKYFEIKLCYGASYSAKIVADQLIADYVKTYVKGKTLYLEIDEKSYAPEVKKALKGKNAIVPTLTATIYAPSINEIKLSDNVVFTAEDNVRADVAKIELKGNASIKKLALDAHDVAITMGNKTQGRYDIYSNSVTVNASNSSSATFAINCSSISVGTAGSSNVSMNVETKSIAIKSEGSSTVTVNGSSTKLSVNGSNSSSILADGMVVNDADVVLTNSALSEVNSKDYLKIDIIGSSHLVFNGKPNVEVSRIVSSTVTRAGDTKYKKK